VPYRKYGGHLKQADKHEGSKSKGQRGEWVKGFRKVSDFFKMTNEKSLEVSRIGLFVIDHFAGL